MSDKRLHITPPDGFCAPIALPASKSISNRALIINALSGGTCSFGNLSDCDDTQALIRALQTPHGTIDIGAAGTAMRFLTAYLATRRGHWLLTGSERMKRRPIGALVDALRQLGADIAYTENDGFPPLAITGKKLHGGALTPHFDESSQFFSALMMVAPYIDGGLTLHLTNRPASMPYIALTAAMMRQSGAGIHMADDEIHIAESRYRPTHFAIENDWSAASYWYELVAIAQTGTCILAGLNQNSLQGDSKIAELFAPFGVTTRFDGGNAVVLYQKTDTPARFDHDFGNMPDMAQTFAVLCCARGVPFHFTGLKTLKIKETDRIAALVGALGKCGFILAEPAEGELTWSGTRTTATTEPLIRTHGDHRMAMAFAPLAAKMPLRIGQPEVVRKSYPRFWEELAKIGL